MPFVVRAVSPWMSAALVAVACWGCGGGGGGSTPGGGGGGTTPPPVTSANPCTTALEASAELAFLSLTNTTAAADAKRADLHGQTKIDRRDALWVHRAQRERQRYEPRSEVADPTAVTAAAGHIAVIEDDGTIFLPANTFDLANTGLRFRPSGAGYEVTRIDGAFRASLGSRLTLADDDTTRVALSAPLPYFGNSVSEAFVNSDGNVTFGAGDGSSSARSIGRFLSGAPRVAGFFADLDPSAGGGVFANADTSGLIVTWCRVPGFDDPNTVTAQAALLADGTIELKFAEVTLAAAVVGVSPGSAEAFQPADLSVQGPTAGGDGAVGERFSTQSETDLVSAAQRFYRAFPDEFDQLVFWGEQRLIPLGEAFAREFTVQNAIQGIGAGRFADQREFGAASRLQSIVNMDRIQKYPDNPATRFLGPDTVMSLVGHETGHRWLAFVDFVDHTRQRSSALLGRDDAHWSFFFDSDSSVMEGNDIEALGGGAFRTVNAVTRYSRLDQYLMGLVAPADVPPFFYVEAPTNIVPGRDRTSNPEIGVTFNGTRRDVLIQDVIDVMGPRVPAAADAPKQWRQAWIYLTARGSAGRPEDIARIETWRAAWEPFFQQATDGRMRVEARLR